MAITAERLVSKMVQPETFRELVLAEIQRMLAWATPIKELM